MSNVDHAKEAERLLADGDQLLDPHLLTMAQVHATLAVAQRLAEVSDILETRSLTVDLVRR